MTACCWWLTACGLARWSPISRKTCVARRGTTATRCMRTPSTGVLGFAGKALAVTPRCGAASMLSPGIDWTASAGAVQAVTAPAVLRLTAETRHNLPTTSAVQGASGNVNVMCAA